MSQIIWNYVVVVLYWIGLYTYPAILPVYVLEIVQNLSLTGAILSMYGLVQIFIRLPLGIASDVLGKRKNFIILGLIALGTGPLILARSTSATNLFIGRAVTGFAAGTWVPLSAHIIDKNASNVFKTTNTLSLLSNLARVFAVIAAPFLTITKFGVTAPFHAAFISALFALIIWMVSMKGAKETKTTLSFQEVRSEIVNPEIFLPGLMFAVIQFGVFATTFTFIPLLGKKIQLPDTQFNALLITYFLISIIVNILLNRVVNNKNKRLIGIFAFIILSVGIIIIGYSESFMSLMVAQIAIGISYGISFPLFLGFSMSKSKSESRAISMGIFQSAESIGMFLGPPLSTRLAEMFGIPTMSLILSPVITVLGVVLFFLKKNNGVIQQYVN